MWSTNSKYNKFLFQCAYDSNDTAYQGRDSDPECYDDVFTVTAEGNSWTVKSVNGIDFTRTYPTTLNSSFTETGGPLFLFAMASGDAVTAGYYSAHRLYTFRIYTKEAGEYALVHNLVPARRDSDSATGLYDTETNKFYPNSGSGSFVLPADSSISTRILLNSVRAEVPALAEDAVLYLAYGAAAPEEASLPVFWNSLVPVARLSAGVAASVEVGLPAGWNDTVNALRLFAAPASGSLYLNGTGTQFIDTGVVNDLDSVVELDLELASSGPSSWCGLYGCTGSNNNQNQISLLVNPHNMRGDFEANRVDNTTDPCIWGGSSSELKNAVSGYSSFKAKATLSAARRSIDLYTPAGAVIKAPSGSTNAPTNDTPVTTSFTCDASAYLFAIRCTDSTAQHKTINSHDTTFNGGPYPGTWVYSCRISSASTDEVVCDILPAKLAGIAQMRDIVRNLDLPNIGTGSFSLGYGNSPALAESEILDPSQERGGMIIFVR